MSSDGRYYIRAGAHSVPARSILVEALWVKRNQRHPKLIHLIREHRLKPDILQLVVTNISPEPALNVELKLDPLPVYWKCLTEEHNLNQFPLRYPVIDQIFGSKLISQHGLAGKNKLAEKAQSIWNIRI